MTKGMKFELEVAKKAGIPIELYDENFSSIPRITLSIDDRIDEQFMIALHGARIE